MLGQIYALCFSLYWPFVFFVFFFSAQLNTINHNLFEYSLISWWIESEGLGSRVRGA